MAGFTWHRPARPAPGNQGASYKELTPLAPAQAITAATGAPELRGSPLQIHSVQLGAPGAPAWFVWFCASLLASPPTLEPSKGILTNSRASHRCPAWITQLCSQRPAGEGASSPHCGSVCHHSHCIRDGSEHIDAAGAQPSQPCPGLCLELNGGSVRCHPARSKLHFFSACRKHCLLVLLLPGTGLAKQDALDRWVHPFSRQTLTSGPRHLGASQVCFCLLRRLHGPPTDTPGPCVVLGEMDRSQATRWGEGRAYCALRWWPGRVSPKP